ncbi:MAG: uL15m family ribosomal protein [Candidatus Micrarchaeota archaeon]
MVEKRKGKRNRKFLGTRNHGKGNAKNCRGKGGKGGWGRAGMHKHRFSYITTYERDWMTFGGRKGFVPPTQKRMSAINLYDIDNLAKANKLQSKDGKLLFEFDGKILGSGSLSQPVTVIALSASEKAIERIGAAGGKFESVAPTQKKESGGVKTDHMGNPQKEAAVKAPKKA